MKVSINNKNKTFIPRKEKFVPEPLPLYIDLPKKSIPTEPNKEENKEERGVIIIELF